VLYAEAENLLLAEIGLDSFSPSTENIISIELSEVFGDSGRFDAEFYQMKYRQYHQILARHSEGYKLCNLAVLTKGNQARSISDKGVLYASIKDVIGFTIETEERTNEGELILVEPSELVLAITGATIGKVGINATNEEIAISGDLVGIKTHDISPYYLQVVLASKPIQEMCRQYTTGATNGHLAVSDVANFPIPLIDDSIQEKISNQVIWAIESKRESKRLLELAKRAVEIAIEQNESAALQIVADGTQKVSE